MRSPPYELGSRTEWHFLRSSVALWERVSPRPASYWDYHENAVHVSSESDVGSDQGGSNFEPEPRLRVEPRSLSRAADFSKQSSRASLTLCRGKRSQGKLFLLTGGPACSDGCSRDWKSNACDSESPLKGRELTTVAASSIAANVGGLVEEQESLQ